MTPDELRQLEVLRRNRADMDAVRASACYSADTCTMDAGCPFAVNCLATEGAQA